jgi:uncharacterized membrane protein YGL010W
MGFIRPEDNGAILVLKFAIYILGGMLAGAFLLVILAFPSIVIEKVTRGEWAVWWAVPVGLFVVLLIINLVTSGEHHDPS